ncbi:MULTISPECIES: heavy metal-binding domain-containing protein [Flavobacterium]|uniref:heavy metal-binding domain-containing protein n=1 Tax=Flavobacterium TaxID=237 RepID=UPI002481FE9A|nr:MULTISPECIES: heavy metal-binding domain-containing protein [Flavobacterium]
MKTLIIALVLFFSMGSAVWAQTTQNAVQKEVQKTMYACPMHSNEISDKKGKCGKCGMELVVTKTVLHNTAVKGSQTSSVKSKKYICTMDGSVLDEPGKCPKCGKVLTEKKMDSKTLKH